MAKNGSKESAKGKSEKRVSSGVVGQKPGKKDGPRKGKNLERTTDGRESGKGIKGVKKEYLDPASSCKVTFRLPKEAAVSAREVAIVGDFTNWDKGALPMHRLKSGDFEIMIELRSNAEYRFRYLIDGHRWENDWCADTYKPNPYGCDDSVIIL